MELVTKLITQLRDTTDNVRRQVVEILSDIQDPRSVPALVEALQDTDENVRWNAGQVLEELGPSAVPALIDALKSSDVNVLKKVVDLLGESHDPQTIPALVEALSHPDETIRKAAVVSLWHTKASLAIPALIESLGDPEPEVRYFASQALGGVQGRSPLPALVAALADPDESLIWCIHGVLRRCGTAAIPPLIEGLKSRNPAVRWNAAVILGDIGNAGAVPALVKVLKKDGSLLYYSLWANWPFLRTVAKALSAIAGCDPDPVLRSALWVLHSLRNLDPGFEEALYFQDAIDKIDAATAPIKNLPLPAAPPLDSQNLPLPAVAPVLSPDGLPIPSAPTADNPSDCPGQKPITRSRWWIRQEKRT